MCEPSLLDRRRRLRRDKYKRSLIENVKSLPRPLATGYFDKLLVTNASHSVMYTHNIYIYRHNFKLIDFEKSKNKFKTRYNIYYFYYKIG